MRTAIMANVLNPNILEIFFTLFIACDREGGQA